MAEITTFSRDAAEKIARVVRQVLAEPRIVSGRPAMSAYGHGFWIAKTDGSGVTARSGDTPGSGTVTLYEIDSAGDLAEVTSSGDASAVTKTAYNLSTTAVSSATYIMCSQEIKSGKLFVVWEDC